MNCVLNPQEQEELLIGYCAFTLDTETARSYERHLRDCKHCAALVEMQRRVDESLEAWTAPELSRDFDQKLFARIRAEEQAPKAWWQFWAGLNLGWKPALPLALAALVLIFALLRSTAPTEVAQQNDSIQAEEIEQVERALDVMEGLQALHSQDAVAATAATKESL